MDERQQTEMREARAKLEGVDERRRLAIVDLRQAFTETADDWLFRGLASRTEHEYTVHDAFGPFTEIVESGAFKITLSESPKVVYLENHRGLPLASTKAEPATLRLWESGDGLEVEAMLSKRSTRAADIVDGIRRGDIDEMSFAFRVVRQRWSPDFTTRRILQVNLHRGDVSVVTYGANDATSAAIRTGNGTTTTTTAPLTTNTGNVSTTWTTTTTGPEADQLAREAAEAAETEAAFEASKRQLERVARGGGVADPYSPDNIEATLADSKARLGL